MVSSFSPLFPPILDSLTFHLKKLHSHVNLESQCLLCCGSEGQIHCFEISPFSLLIKILKNTLELSLLNFTKEGSRFISKKN